ncbi:MAG: ABC transporter substrate-binding protein, partial [Actinomycetota bacterium]
SAQGAAQLEGAPAITVAKSPFAWVVLHYINVLNKPLSDARVRRAMRMAVDTNEVIQKAAFGAGVPSGPVPTGYGDWYLDPKTLPYLKPDVEGAKKLLAEAGYPNGFKVGLACPSGAYPNDKEACQAIAGYLQRLAIEVDLQVMEPNRFWDLEAKRQLPPLFFDGVGDRNQDPDTQLKGVAHPDSKWTAFEKPEFSDLIMEGGSTVDPEARKRAYAKLARAMQADPPFLFLWQIRNFEGVRKRVQGYTTRPNESMGHVAFDVSVAD